MSVFSLGVRTTMPGCDPSQCGIECCDDMTYISDLVVTLLTKYRKPGKLDVTTKQKSGVDLRRTVIIPSLYTSQFSSPSPASASYSVMVTCLLSLQVLYQRLGKPLSSPNTSTCQLLQQITRHCTDIANLFVHEIFYVKPALFN